MLELYVRLMTWFAEARDNERGASAVEYGLMVGLIAAVIVATVASLGGKLNTAFQTVVSKLP